MSGAANEGHFTLSYGSGSDSGTVFVSGNITRECVGSSAVSLQTIVAALMQAFRPYSKLHNCGSSDLVQASNFDSSALVLVGAAQPVRMDLLRSSGQ